MSRHGTTASREAVGAAVLSDHRCTLGEGVTYDPVSDTAWWFDIVEKKLFEHRFSRAETIIHSLPFMASQLSFIDDGAQLVAGEDGLYRRDIGSGDLALVRALEEDNPVTRSNDGRVHPCGALWIGTMGKREESRAGAIYWFFRGVLRLLFQELSIPNAICFSPDGTIGYFTDTADGRLMRVALDPETGLPRGEPMVFHDTRGRDGGADGAVVDADGNLWNARYGGGSLDVYGADGTRLHSYEVPATQPTSPAFFGPSADRLLVTSSRQALSEAELAADPEAGKTFQLDLAVCGRFDARVKIA